MIRIDAHQHFWHYDPQAYSWIGDSMKVLKRDFLPANLLPELQATQVEGSIAVQARKSLRETQWLLELANKNDFIQGVVGWVDLCSDKVEDQLKTFAVNPKFVGVRHVIHDEPDDHFMARDDFQHGISRLKKYGLSYDLLLFPKHLPLATELVQKFPDQKFVLDHIAKPDIKGQKDEPWASDIRKFAQLSNVYCKLSGMVTEASWHSWKTNDFRFYLDTVLESFGPERVMMGSDWPVCNLAGNYRMVLELVTDYVQKFDPAIQQKILGANCLEFYLK